jgi:hypothetical protein
MQYLKCYQKKKKILHLFPQFYFIFMLKNNKIKKQKKHAYGEKK